MAREIHEREDLLRDARALVPRVQLHIEVDGRASEIFAGFRGESLSLYFGDDPVFHFNDDGQLRRAYVGDRLIKAERGRLVSLERKREAKEVVLQRHALDDAAQQTLLRELAERLTQLAAALSRRQFHVVGQVPPDSDAVARLKRWLAAHSALSIAASPRVG